MGKFPNNYVEMVYHLSHHFSLEKQKNYQKIKIFFIKVSLSALLALLREQNVLMSFLLPNNLFMSLQITGKLLAGRLFIKVTEFPMFELTFSPVFDCNESNSENSDLGNAKLSMPLFFSK